MHLLVVASALLIGDLDQVYGIDIYFPAWKGAFKRGFDFLLSIEETNN